MYLAKIYRFFVTVRREAEYCVNCACNGTLPSFPLLFFFLISFVEM